ncbi:hypothetical protein DL93DRAFT_2221274 [Clavulina sp. PMI_390]|nr:hypothetical protein DL93DRAFT_2221274 [Clavulina sp. PMI_390]
MSTSDPSNDSYSQAEATPAAPGAIAGNERHEDLDWHLDDNGGSLLRPPASDISAPLGLLQRISTRASTHSASVPQFGVLECSLSDFCNYVDANLSLQTAEIISTECYTQSAGAVTHRFVVLELRRPNRRNAWLRLDRRRGKNVSILRFLAVSGVTVANDRLTPHLQAQLSAEKDLLTENALSENRQEFPVPPDLGELARLLRIINDEILKYRIWPENCWFFCSLIQEHLGGLNDDLFVIGGPKYNDLAPQIRLRVFRRVLKGRAVGPGLSQTRTPSVDLNVRTDLAQRPVSPREASHRSASFSPAEIAVHLPAVDVELETLVQATEPPTHPALWTGLSPATLYQLGELSRETSPDASGLAAQAKTCLDLSSQLANVESPPSRSVIAQTNALLTTLRYFVNDLSDHARTRDALLIRQDLVQLQRIMCREVPLHDQNDLAHDLIFLAVALHQQTRNEEACAVAKEAVTIRRATSEYHHSELSHSELAEALLSQAVYSSLSGKPQESCSVDAEAVGIYQELYASRPGFYRAPLALILRNYCRHLGEARRFAEAVDAGNEAVSHRRTLVDTDPDRHKAMLIGDLYVYGNALEDVGRGKDARLAKEESEALRNELNQARESSAEPSSSKGRTSA